MKCRWYPAGFLLAGLVISSQVAAFTVFIDRPTFLEPALGEVEVLARVESREPVRSLALFVDGRPQAILESAPYRWIVDVGEKNVQHLFQVVATSPSGETAEAVVETPRLHIDEQVDLELQQLYVTVTRESSTVEDLTRSQFAIEDRGESQELVTFERGDIPLTAVLLFDVSASMSGAELEMALSSSRAFIEGLHPLDRTMLLMFSDRIVRATNFTGFREVLTAALSTVVATGATALNDYLYVGLKQLERRQGRRVVILLSDGIDSASVLGMKDVLQYSDHNPSLVYWLRLPAPGARISSAWRDAEGYRRELARLADLVTRSGGRILDLDGVEDAAGAFADVLEELRGQYVLGYYPTTREDDGTWHPVKVRVAGPGLKVRTRRGYIDY
jgi:Ca-activated chloride channel family protein